MKLAIVTGQIVCTVRHQGLAHDKLLMVEMIDAQGNPDGQCAVAIDSIGSINCLPRAVKMPMSKRSAG